jgi:hypothetical protein
LQATGRKTAFPLRTKNRQQTKQPLDRKTPIQVGEIDEFQRDGNRILTQPPPPAGVFFAIVNNIGGGQDGQVDTVGIIDLEASPPRVIDQVVASRGARVISLAACRLSEACVSQRLDA